MSGGIAHEVRQACHRWPDRVAVVDVATSRATTFTRLAAMIDEYAAALRTALADHGARGHRTRAVVAVDPGPVEGADTLAAVLACGEIGAVALVRNPVHPAFAWSRQLAVAQPDLRLTPDGVLPGSPPDDAGPRKLLAERTYQLVATSGSSGTPKLVQLTDSGTLLAAAVYRAHAAVSPGEAVAVPQSLAGVGALPSGVLPAILDGGTAVLSAGVGIGTFLGALTEHRAVFAMAITGWWQAVLRARALPAVPALRLLGVGGSPWQHLATAMQRWLPAAVILGNYGLTETHGPALQVTSAHTARFASVTGRTVGGLELAIRDDAGAEAPAGTPGVLWLRGDLVTPGYLVAAGHADPDADGWLCTGDVAVLDRDGWVHVVDRADDVVNVGGRKVYPAEVEAALHGLDGVADCAVVRSSGPAGQRRLGAFVVAADPVPAVDQITVRRWIRDALGDHAVPTLVAVIPDLPRTGNGKVDRRALRGRLDASSS